MYSLFIIDYWMLSLKIAVDFIDSLRSLAKVSLFTQDYRGDISPILSARAHFFILTWIHEFYEVV